MAIRCIYIYIVTLWQIDSSCHILISSAWVVPCHVGCLWITSVTVIFYTLITYNRHSNIHHSHSSCSKKMNS